MEIVHKLINFAPSIEYSMEKVRQIKLFKNYYKEFYVAQTQTVRDKINFVLRMVESQRIIPKKFFRILEGSDGIYEIRVEIESNIYRVFCCMDEGAMVVLFHGIQKKSQKTPSDQIARAERLKKREFDIRIEYKRLIMSEIDRK